MSARLAFGWGPILTAFSVWFVHFMTCWSAAEIWPRQWQAHALAWGATAIALLAVGVHFMRLRAQHDAGKLPGWRYRFAQGAAAIAAAAVLFSAVPSLVFLPTASQHHAGFGGSVARRRHHRGVRSSTRRHIAGAKQIGLRGGARLAVLAPTELGRSPAHMTPFSDLVLGEQASPDRQIRGVANELTG